jgi:hypothetical protein
MDSNFRFRDAFASPTAPPLPTPPDSPVSGDPSNGRPASRSVCRGWRLLYDTPASRVDRPHIGGSQASRGAEPEVRVQLPPAERVCELSVPEPFAARALCRPSGQHRGCARPKRVPPRPERRVSSLVYWSGVAERRFECRISRNQMPCHLSLVIKIDLRPERVSAGRQCFSDSAPAIPARLSPVLTAANYGRQQWAREEPKVRRLPAGGRWIRTIGSARQDCVE